MEGSIDCMNSSTGIFFGAVAKFIPKAKLLHYLESSPDSSPVVETPMGSVWIVDGMAMLQQMSPKFMPDNMGQLSEKILRQLVNLAHANQSSTVHFVTDRYPVESIKNAERKCWAASGSENKNISKPIQPIPKQWKKIPCTWL